MTRLEVRNVAATVLRAYLVDELGGRGEGDTVEGNGWSVRFIESAPVVVRQTRIPVLFMEVEGGREEEVARLLRRKSMRGGG